MQYSGRLADTSSGTVTTLFITPLCYRPLLWRGSFLALLLALLLVLLVVPVSVRADVGAPVIPKPPPWQPDKVVVFGDSLSDSNGDSFRKPEFAYSTYNLLRTLNGELNTLPDGSQRRPLDLDKILSKRMTVENIRANFQLMIKDIRSELRERSYFGRIMGYMELEAVQSFATLLDSVLLQLDAAEDSMTSTLLPLLSKASAWVARQAQGMRAGSWLRGAMLSIEQQLTYLSVVLKQSIAGALLDFGDDQIINIISSMPGTVPLIPDPNYYATGKWTASSTNLAPLVWIEFLQRMMSAGGHEVKLDNRAMAGSWTLCAYDKIRHINILDELTEGVVAGMKMLFQGSMIPPCEGLIVRSYLDEARNRFQQTHGRLPGPGDKLFDPNTLVIFFNSANDFLNKWSDPDDIAQEYARDIWTVLDAGARRVAVVLMPDISDTPRFHPDQSQPKSQEARQLSAMVERYNTSLRMRLNLLREEFNGDYGFQIMTIDGAELFRELRRQPRWELEHPILNIAIPGLTPAGQAGAQPARAENFVQRELRNNRSFDDVWNIQGVNPPAAGRLPFFADTVHPSAEAHLAIAEWACQQMRDRFNVPCVPEAGAVLKPGH